MLTHPGGWLRKECLSAVPVFTLYVPPCPDLSWGVLLGDRREEISENLLYGEIRPLSSESGTNQSRGVESSLDGVETLLWLYRDLYSLACAREYIPRGVAPH